MQRTLVGLADDRRLRTPTAQPARSAEPVSARTDGNARIAAPTTADTGSAERTIGALQRSAGNAAVASLMADQVSGSATSVQRDLSDDDDEQQPVSESSSLDQAQDVNELAGGDGATELDDGASTPAAGTGQSWTKVGPPSSSTYAVSGTLRKASEAVAARTEAGSVTTTPSLDTDAPVERKDGTQVVPAARVTAKQVMELPVWSSRAGPDSNEGKPTANQEAEWNRFSTAIASHEAGHVAKDKTAFADAHTKIKGKSPTDGDAAFDTVTNQATTANEAYDTANDHGRNEGTTLNPNIDEVTKVP